MATNYRFLIAAARREIYMNMIYATTESLGTLLETPSMSSRLVSAIKMSDNFQIPTTFCGKSSNGGIQNLILFNDIITNVFVVLKL